MAKITYLRRSFSLHADGSRTEHDKTETANWPMMTCNNFKAQYPDQVISITAEDLDYDHGVRHGAKARGEKYQWKGSRNNDPIPLVRGPAAAPAIDMSGAAYINAAARKLAS